MQSNPTWKDYLIFSKKERAVVAGLIVFLLFLISLSVFYEPQSALPVVENLDEKIAGLSVPQDSSFGMRYVTQTASAVTETGSAVLFNFDPNTLDERGFEELGLRAKTIHTILNYRNKGGHFRTPGDIRKIYGLHEEEANRLIPFIQIGLAGNKNEGSPYGENRRYVVKQQPKAIDINTATVEEWKSLPMIGDVLSQRIVNYRDKMGGFTSIEQVSRTFGLSDSAYRIIVPFLRLSSQAASKAIASSPSTKININKASAAELKKNSNIPPDVADAIVIYRKQHGDYTSVEDIRKIIFINDAIYESISGYLSTN